MSAQTTGSGIIFPMTGAAVLVGVLWFLVTGELWQFVPIVAAVFVAFRAAKAVGRWQG